MSKQVIVTTELGAEHPYNADNAFMDNDALYVSKGDRTIAIHRDWSHAEVRDTPKTAKEPTKLGTAYIEVSVEAERPSLADELRDWSGNPVRFMPRSDIFPRVQDMKTHCCNCTNNDSQKEGK